MYFRQRSSFFDRWGGADWSIKPSTGNTWAKSEVILRDFEARSSTEPAKFGMQASTYLELASLQKHQQVQGYNKKLFETASFIVHRKLGLIYMSIVFQHSIRIWDLYMWLFFVAKRKFYVYVWLPCVYLRPSSNVCENLCVCGGGIFAEFVWVLEVLSEVSNEA